MSIIEEIIIGYTGDVKIRKYSKGNPLGIGKISICYEFTILENQKMFVGKIINKAKILKPKGKQKLIKEIKIHKASNHPHIVSLEHYFEDKENVYILYELCKNKTLNDLLKVRKKLTEIEVKCYMVQIIKALKYMHSHKVIHRNLELENLLLTENMELKVGGFSSAAKLEKEGEKRKTICGSTNYLSPEMANKKGYSYEVDIWPLRIILYTLLIGKTPFEDKDDQLIIKKIKLNSYSFPNNVIISENAKNLISKILILDPKKRPSLDQILIHDFFTQEPIPKLKINNYLESLYYYSLFMLFYFFSQLIVPYK